jgi:hypothetical protein
MILGVILIGLILISAAVNNTAGELGTQLQGDLLGTDGFVTWIVAIGALGALGYVPQLRTTSRYMILLLLVVLVLRNGGLWANATQALQLANSDGPAPAIATASGPASSGTQTASSSGGGGLLGGLLGGGGSSSSGADAAAVAAIALA